MRVEAKQVPMIRYSDGEKVALGGSEAPEIPKQLEGLTWKLKSGNLSTMLIYSLEEGGYDTPVLLSDDTRFFDVPGDLGDVGTVLLYNLSLYELKSGKLLLTSSALNNGSIDFEFDFETENSGTFNAKVLYPRPVRNIKGTFTIENYDGPNRNILGYLD